MLPLFGPQDLVSEDKHHVIAIIMRFLCAMVCFDFTSIRLKHCLFFISLQHMYFVQQKYKECCTIQMQFNK
jgi:hypothetical protein